MITKQQALEFIYDISNSFSINMDLTKGVDCYVNVYSDSCGTFGVEGDFNSLEEAITEFIKRFGNTALLEDLECLIPVDVDMLEVGQTYKVELDDFYDGCHSVHIAKYIGKKEEYYYFKNRHTWRYEKKDLYQLWKMNKKESEER